MSFAAAPGYSLEVEVNTVISCCRSFFMHIRANASPQVISSVSEADLSLCAFRY